MKTIDFTEKMSDPVISEARAIKRQVVAEHGGDLDSFFAAIRKRQASNPRLVKSTKAGDADEKGTTHPESK